MICEELKDLPTHFKDPEHAAQTTDLIRDIDRIVDKANRNADWRREHMMYELLELDAEKRGEAIGEAKGAIKTLTQLAKDGLLDIKEACKRANMTEKEFEVLLAAR